MDRGGRGAIPSAPQNEGLSRVFGFGGFETEGDQVLDFPRHGASAFCSSVMDLLSEFGV
jgi:hypothetical protein